VAGQPHLGKLVRRLSASALCGRTGQRPSGIDLNADKLCGGWVYAAILNQSICRTQPISGFQLMKIWATIYSIHRKWLKVRGVGGSIARNVGFDNVLISNDILLETRLKSNRTRQTASMS
jgi:hypothetical protein